MFLYILIVLVSCFYLYHACRKPTGYPPGPRWWPLVGSYFYFRKLRKDLGFIHLVWKQLAEDYGPLVGMKLGTSRVVIASGCDVVRQILKREEFDFRPDGFFIRLRSFGERTGLVFADGDFFNEQKRFVSRHLKSSGGRPIEDLILMEIELLVDELKTKDKGVVSFPDDIEISVINSLWIIVAGQRFQPGDPRPKELLRNVYQSFRLVDMSGGLLNQMPFLRYIAPDKSSYRPLVNFLQHFFSFLRELVDDHKRTPQSKDSLIESYFKEFKSTGSSVPDAPLLVLLLDLFLAGSETTTGTLGFIILYLIHYPDVQCKIQNELDNILGEKQPTVADKARLKYTEAFIMEIQRHQTVAPTTVSHRACRDTYFDGFFIPKDTLILADLNSVHMEEKYWGDPGNFRPERFLDADGNIIKTDSFLPFGLGKRRCVGENIAKLNIFLFVTTILSQFNITSGIIPPIDASDGASVSPKPFKCVFTPRKKLFIIDN